MRSVIMNSVYIPKLKPNNPSVYIPKLEPNNRTTWATSAVVCINSFSINICMYILIDGESFIYESQLSEI